jgi:hypothetical protein
VDGGGLAVSFGWADRKNRIWNKCPQTIIVDKRLLKEIKGKYYRSSMLSAHVTPLLQSKEK